MCRSAAFIHCKFRTCRFFLRYRSWTKRSYPRLLSSINCTRTRESSSKLPAREMVSRYKDGQSAALKQEIGSQLGHIHLVTPAVFTFDEMARSKFSANDISSIRTSSITHQSSPLELALEGKGEKSEQVAQLAQNSVQNAPCGARRDSKLLADLARQLSTQQVL